MKIGIASDHRGYKLKEQLKIETDIKKQEELNDLIIKIKKGSED